MDTALILPSLLISFISGIRPVIYKHMLKNIDMKTLIAIGETIYFMCTLGFIIYYWKDISVNYKNIKYHDLLIITLMSIATAFVANVVYLKLLMNNHSYIVAILVSISPLFTLAFAYFILKEQMSVQGIIGFLFILIGIVFIAMNKSK